MYAQTLARVDARYIIILAPSGTTADIYFSLAIRNQSVGPDYVWLGYNLPMSQSDPVELYGANYYKYLRGFILPAWGAPQSDHMTSMQNMVTDNINIHTQVYGFNVTSNDIGIQTNAFQFFDCVGVLANGLSNIITEKGFNVSDLRKPNVQDHLNYTTFKSTGFRGLDADPIELTSFGDIATPYIYLVMDGLDENLGYKAFAVSDSDVQNLYPYITKDFVFQFYNGSVPPLDGPSLLNATEVIVTSSSSEARLVIALQVVGLVVCTFLFPINFKKITFESFKGTVPFWLMTNFAAITSFISMSFYLGRASVTSCLVRAWIPPLSFVVAFACLFAKNIRVQVIYASKSVLIKLWTSDILYLAIVFGLIVTEVAILLAWTYNANLKVAKVSQKALSKYVYICQTSNGSNASILLWVYHTFLIFLTLL
ncbi:hypothetical protein BCR33DRAFT_393642 [Rhizoclosmatium globosum]|uniref:G-protein coupled receptors family 3 profile domain-containing protein n=1 Tax=Rhizoclosmatium globosum TaxID=329046 RepID=A0A1Y2BY11_9FUNG|nr:hypothetical protein BCR33DRAFT_393642 [Rhizoclosmatium globosum]|eukprot:ORY39660.1 hypothetical protein BCR33DRAFT_393642 [Rhizoclosmatium globosum]